MGISSTILFSSVLSRIFLTYSTTKVEIYWNLWIWLPNFTNSPVKSYNVFLFFILSYIFINYILYYLFIYFMHKGTLSTCTSAHPKKASDSYELPCGGWELTLGLLEEQWVLLITEPSLSPQERASFGLWFQYRVHHGKRHLAADMMTGAGSWLVTLFSTHRKRRESDNRKWGKAPLRLSITSTNSITNWGRSVQVHEPMGNCFHSHHPNSLKLFWLLVWGYSLSRQGRHGSGYPRWLLTLQSVRKQFLFIQPRTTTHGVTLSHSG